MRIEVTKDNGVVLYVCPSQDRYSIHTSGSLTLPCIMMILIDSNVHVYYEDKWSNDHNNPDHLNMLESIKYIKVCRREVDPNTGIHRCDVPVEEYKVTQVRYDNTVFQYIIFSSEHDVSSDTEKYIESGVDVSNGWNRTVSTNKEIAE